jgi:hypothetical protein
MNRIFAACACLLAFVACGPAATTTTATPTSTVAAPSPEVRLPISSSRTAPPTGALQVTLSRDGPRFGSNDASLPAPTGATVTIAADASVPVRLLQEALAKLRNDHVANVGLLTSTGRWVPLSPISPAGPPTFVTVLLVSKGKEAPGFLVIGNGFHMAPGCREPGRDLTVPPSGGTYDFAGLTLCASALQSSALPYVQGPGAVVAAGADVDVQTLVSTIDALRGPDGRFFTSVWLAMPAPAPPANALMTVAMANDDSVCVIRSQGAVWCKAALDRDWIDTKVRGALAIRVGSGPQGSCALARDGYVFCWGGRGAVARPVPGFVGKDIAVGEEHACAVRTDGGILCWRHDDPPIAVSGVPRAEQIVARGRTSCARATADGSVWCWDEGASAARPVALPRPVKNLVADFDAVRAEQDDGRQCWIHGVGAGASDVMCTSPSRPDLARLRIGARFACALDASGRVLCTDPGQSGPWRPVTGVRNAVDIAMGSTSACAVIAGGSAVCWEGLPEAGAAAMTLEPPR